jgi:hypothetical protein
MYMNAKNIVIAVLALALIGAVGYLLMNESEDMVVVIDDKPETTQVEERLPATETEVTETAETVEETGPVTIGKSVEGTDVVAYRFGSGETEVLLVGGVHGGYSPNTAELGNRLVSHFESNENAIPANLSVTIIPNLNPDGGEKSGTAGRFNSNEVDLNRNFDCEWSETAVWRQQEVSGGTEAFSEPEAAALRDYVLAADPAAAVVWFSAEGKVYPSACAGTPSNQSVTLAATFATAAGYPSEAEFDAYAITGDMVNWMAKQDIPAISVLLSDHQNTEWAKNLAGVEAILNSYAE